MSVLILAVKIADNETAKDVTRILGLRPNTLVFRQSVDRPNLFYEVAVRCSYRWRMLS